MNKKSIFIILFSGLFSISIFAAETVEEVIVTAKKRSENLQEVSISVDAFSGDRLENANLRGQEELANLVPGLQSAGIMSSEMPLHVLRGIGTLDYMGNNQTPVAVHLDGFYRGMNALMAGQFFDIERVEVLKGPQGTLYGKNTSGGAINYFTTKPNTESNEGYVVLTAGDLSLQEARFAYNVPLSDNFAVRLAGKTSERDGWIKHASNSDLDAGSKDNNGLRLSALWTPDDTTELIFRASSTEAKPIEWHSNQGEGRVGALGAYNGLYDLFFALGQTPYGTASLPKYGEQDNNFDTQNTFDTDTMSFEINKELQNHTLTLMLSSDEHENKRGEDFDGTQMDAAMSVYTADFESDSVEVRLTSNLDGPFNYIIGYFSMDDTADMSYDLGLYLDVDWNGDGTVNVTDQMDIMALAFGSGSPSDAGTAMEAVYQSMGMSLGDFIGLGQATKNSFTQDRTSESVFFDSTYEISEKLSLEFGYRYTDDEVSVIDFNSYARSAGDNVPLLAYIPYSDSDPFAKAATVSTDSTNSSIKLGLNYVLDSGNLLYAKYSEGYRGAAINGAAFYAIDELSPVDEETVESIELGSKNILMDGRLRLNLAYFDNSWDDMQNYDFSFGPNGEVFQVLLNLPEVESSGFEIDSEFVINDSTSLYFGASFLDSEIVKGIYKGVNIAGQQLPMSPDTNFNIALNRNIFLNDSGSMDLYIEHIRVDDQCNGLNTTVCLPSYDLSNLNISYDSTQNWDLNIWVKNLTDEKINIWAGDAQDYFQIDHMMYAPPRTFGVDFRFIF